MNVCGILCHPMFYFCVFQNYDRLLVTTWGHDPAVILTSNILLTLNDALSHSAVLIQVRCLKSYRICLVLLCRDCKNNYNVLQQGCKVLLLFLFCKIGTILGITK